MPSCLRLMEHLSFPPFDERFVDTLATWGRLGNSRCGTGVSNQLVENGSRHQNLVATCIWNRGETNSDIFAKTEWKAN